MDGSVCNNNITSFCFCIFMKQQQKGERIKIETETIAYALGEQYFP